MGFTQGYSVSRGLDQQFLRHQTNQFHEAEGEDAPDHNIWQERDDSGEKAPRRNEQHPLLE
jgi:hypothetical protein